MSIQCIRFLFAESFAEYFMSVPLEMIAFRKHLIKLAMQPLKKVCKYL